MVRTLSIQKKIDTNTYRVRFCSVIDTCEKYGSGSKDKTSHKEKHFELHSDEVDKRSHSKRKSLKDGVKQNEPKKTCSTKGSPFERRKQEADDPTEDRKRRKLNKEIVKKEVVEVCNFGVCFEFHSLFSTHHLKTLHTFNRHGRRR